MTASPPIEAVVWDLGGVFLDWDPRYVYRELIPDAAEMERFLARVCSPEWHRGNDLGAPYAESCAALAARFPEHAELIHAWGSRTEDMLRGLIPGTEAILHELRAAGLPSYALTNMERETYPQRLARFAFMRSFDGTVVSSAEGVAKPDPEIFRRLLSRFGLTAERSVFIDDSPVNIHTAQELGFVAVHFVGADALRGRLSELGLPLAAA